MHNARKDAELKRKVDGSSQPHTKKRRRLELKGLRSNYVKDRKAREGMTHDTGMAYSVEKNDTTQVPEATTKPATQ